MAEVLPKLMDTSEVADVLRCTPNAVARPGGWFGGTYGVGAWNQPSSAIPGGASQEAWLHQLLAANRVRGEWFADGPAIRLFIAKWEGLRRG